MQFFIDTLAIARYPDRLEFVPSGWGFSGFAETFGPIWPVLNKAVKKKKFWILGGPKHPFFRLQALWDDDHRYNKIGDETRVFAHAERFYRYVIDYPKINWQFSAYCEHKLPNDVMIPLLERLHQKFPKMQLVNSPIAGGDFVNLPYVINEWHHSNPAPPPGWRCQFSYDGKSSFNSDIEKAKRIAENRGAVAFGIWFEQCNLLKNAHDTTPRPDRQAVPIKQLFEIAKTLGTSKKIDSLSRDIQWKAVSQQDGAPIPQPNDNKPSIISPIGGDFTVKSGRKKFKLHYNGQEHGTGDHVYNLLDRHANELKRPVTVFFNDKSRGKIDPCFRSSRRFIES